MVAIGTQDNGVLVRKTESSGEDFPLDLTQFTDPITFICWSELKNSNCYKNLSPFRSGSLVEELLGFVEIHSMSDKKKF